MRGSAEILGLAVLVAGCGSSKTEVGVVARTATQVTFPASDGQTVYADLYSSAKQPAQAVVLMFHQAGSSAREYASIAPQIGDLGFDYIATDQRSGGDLYGLNRTLVKGKQGDYLAAYHDLEGALSYVKSKPYKTIIVWGSSYSSSLVFKLAAEHPEVKGVLSFSPGEYMDDKTAVSGWMSKTTVPVFFACTEDEWADGRSKLFATIASKEKTSNILPGAVHGSSTLIPEKSKAAPDYLKLVTTFLKRWQSK